MTRKTSTVLNTYRTSGFIPIIPQDDTDWVILLDDIEFVMDREQLDRITFSWNNGTSLEKIAKFEERKPLEVLLALLHQGHKGVKLRPFAFRK